MLREGVAWFGDLSTNVAVNVTAPAGNAAQFVSQSVPTTMTAGQQYSVSLTLKNTGGTTWNSGYRFGSQNPRDNSTWGANRVVLGGTAAPGQTLTTTWTVTATATPGNYNFQWQLLQLGVQWFGDLTQNVVVNVAAPAGNAAQFVSQTVPDTMAAGQQYSVTVTFKNTGATIFDTGYALGSQDPRDNMVWGANRAFFSGIAAPGENMTVTFTVTAPSTPGSYDFQWKPIELGIEWFGDLSQNVAVNVQ
jgi:hypothetical protein